MNKTFVNNIKCTLNALILMQLAYDELECIKVGESPFIRENKMRLNQNIKWLSNVCETFTDQMGGNELQNYMDVMDKIRDLINEFGLLFENNMQVKE